jgi:hypothetical protein
MLSDSEKANLRPDLDVPALERLLARVSSEQRARLLNFFSRGAVSDRAFAHYGPTASGSMPQPVMETPELKAMFDEVSEPVRGRARAQRRAYFPERWKDPERRFHLNAVTTPPKGEEDYATIARRTASEGGDVIILPLGSHDVESVVVAIDALMQDVMLPPGAPARTERIALTKQQEIPGMTPEARLIVGDLVGFLSRLPVQPLGDVAAGRTMEVWLLGSP